MGPTLSKGFGRGRCDGARRAGLRSSTHAFWEEQEGRRHDVLTMCRELYIQLVRAHNYDII